MKKMKSKKKAKKRQVIDSKQSETSIDTLGDMLDTVPEELLQQYEVIFDDRLNSNFAFENDDPDLYLSLWRLAQTILFYHDIKNRIQSIVDRQNETMHGRLMVNEEILEYEQIRYRECLMDIARICRKDYNQCENIYINIMADFDNNPVDLDAFVYSSIWKLIFSLVFVDDEVTRIKLYWNFHIAVEQLVRRAEEKRKSTSVIVEKIDLMHERKEVIAQLERNLLSVSSECEEGMMQIHGSQLIVTKEWEYAPKNETKKVGVVHEDSKYVGCDPKEEKRVKVEREDEIRKDDGVQDDPKLVDDDPREEKKSQCGEIEIKKVDGTQDFLEYVDCDPKEYERVEVGQENEMKKDDDMQDVSKRVDDDSKEEKIIKAGLEDCLKMELGHVEHENEKGIGAKSMVNSEDYIALSHSDKRKHVGDDDDNGQMVEKFEHIQKKREGIGDTETHTREQCSHPTPSHFCINLKRISDTSSYQNATLAFNYYELVCRTFNTSLGAASLSYWTKERFLERRLYDLIRSIHASGVCVPMGLISTQ